MSLPTSHRLLLLIVLPVSTSALRISYSEQQDNSVLDPEFEYVSLSKVKVNEILNESYSGVRIANVGWKKTGTTSMHVAYDKLGIHPAGGVNKCKTPSCMHYYAGVEDAYTCCNHGLVEAMKARYTKDQVKFVLTERLPLKWRSSVNHWIARPEKGKHMAKVYGELMGAKFGSEDFYKKYEEHNAFIKNLFADEPDRLLVLNLEEGDAIQNMQKFCKFANIDPEQNAACNKPFPHDNINKKDHGPSFEKNQGTWDFDNNEDELIDYEPKWATFDWKQWYASKGLDLKSDIVFTAEDEDVQLSGCGKPPKGWCRHKHGGKYGGQ